MVAHLPEDTSKWIYEPELDGYRAIAVCNGNEWGLYSMEGQRFDQRYPSVIAALKKLDARNLVLDGEVVALGPTGRPNFNELQNAARTKLPIHYVVFDVLHASGKDLLDSTLEDRKETLDSLAEQFDKPLEKIFVFPGEFDLETITAATQKAKIEGLFGKVSRLQI